MEEIDNQNIPKHIAIIMDGNGRWAKKRFLPRSVGHREGVKAVERTLEAAAKFGVRFLTLYAFSTENWRRPQEEVNALMDLLSRALDKYLDKLQANNVALKIIGDYKKMPENVVDRLEKVVNATSLNDGVTLILALNYSGRWEITEATKRIAKQVVEGKIEVDNIDASLVEQAMMTSFAPAPDLIIRTSGELRISNFLLWQSAYSELYFTSQLWPDFGEDSLREALLDYQKRDRRFGDIKCK